MTKRLTISVEEAAEMLGISRAFAYALVRRNELPSIKLGRRLVVPLSALLRLVDAPGSDDAYIDLTDTEDSAVEVA